MKVQHRLSHVIFDDTGRHAQPRRDVGVGKLVDTVQEEYLTSALGQSRKRRLISLHQFLGFK